MQCEFQLETEYLVEAGMKIIYDDKNKICIRGENRIRIRHFDIEIPTSLYDLRLLLFKGNYIFQYNVK